MPDRGPVVFIHGLWLHATSWQPWIELFSAAGYDPVAPGWPGEADTVATARAHPERVADVGIDDIAEHFASIITGYEVRPILIGHSFGGLIVEKLLGQGHGAAGARVPGTPHRPANNTRPPRDCARANAGCAARLGAAFPR